MKLVRTGNASGAEQAFDSLRSAFQQEADAMKKSTQQIGEKLHHLFVFAEQAFADGNEMLILVTELTVNEYSARFIATFGCPDYQKHNEELMISDRQSKFMAEIDKLDL